MFQTEIRVQFLKADFDTCLELICENGKRDSGAKFTSREFCLPFTQTVEPTV